MPKSRCLPTVETLTKDQDQLLTFFDFPAEHWIHLRTTNPIESPFTTLAGRLRGYLCQGEMAANDLMLSDIRCR